MSVSGVVPTLSIQLRTGWKTIVVWIVALAATMLVTTLSISELYDTQRKIDSYAAATGSGSALEAINGHVYGIATLGGVMANEFGFIASFALPLMGISLISGMTRREEETGRLDMMLAGRIGRGAPVVSAVLVTTVALVLTSAALAGGLVAAGVERADATVYAASLGVLGLVFAGVAAVCAQLVERARGVYTISLGVLVVSYLLRGAGAVLDNPLTWFSPLGWAEEARAFGDARWWPVLMSLGVAAALLAGAGALSNRRDLGSAPLRRGGSVPAASGFLRSRVGFAVRLHRGAVVSWGVAAIVVAGAFGALTDAASEAVSGNETLQDALGGSGGSDGYSAMMVLLLGVLCAGYAVQAVATLRAEETAGRLEVTLSSEVSRTRWFVMHVVVVVMGLLIVTLLGALTLGAATAVSTGQVARFGSSLGAVASYLPAIAVLLAVALALFAAVPRLFPVAWLAFAFTAVVAFLGEVLSLPDWLLDLAPMHHVGFPPQESAESVPLVILVLVAVALGVGGVAAFARRGIPHG